MGCWRGDLIRKVNGRDESPPCEPSTATTVPPHPRSRKPARRSFPAGAPVPWRLAPRPRSRKPARRSFPAGALVPWRLGPRPRRRKPARLVSGRRWTARRRLPLRGRKRRLVPLAFNASCRLSLSAWFEGPLRESPRLLFTPQTVCRRWPFCRLPTTVAVFLRLSVSGSRSGKSPRPRADAHRRGIVSSEPRGHP